MSARSEELIRIAKRNVATYNEMIDYMKSLKQDKTTKAIIGFSI